MTTPAIIVTIEKDLQEAGQWLAHEASTVAHDVWGIFSQVWTTLGPQEWGILIDLGTTVLGKVQSNDMGDILQSLLEEAQVKGHDFVQTLSEDFLNTVLAGLKLKQAKA